jgi:hypothetical protein
VTQQKTKAPKMGRPPEPIPSDASKARVRFRVPSRVLSRLDDMAADAYRKRPAEVLEALRAYLAPKKLPPAPEAHEDGEEVRVQLPAAPVRELDSRSSPEERDARIADAVVRWTQTKR